MNYTFNQLRIFLKVAETLSVTKAAEELHLTQPAVSVQLRNFQRQFALPLIEVVNKKLYITDFGREVAAAAKRVMEEANAINFLIHAFRGELTGKLKISVVSTGKYVAPYFLTDFIGENPGVELWMDVTNKMQVLTSLENNEVDFSLVSVLPENLTVERIDLVKNRLFVVGNGEKHLADKVHDRSIFENLPLIYREPGSGTRHVMERYIRTHNLPVIKKMELTGNEAVKQAVIAGLGYSIMPLIGIRNELETGQLRIIPVKGFPIASTWSLIWLKGKKLSPIALAYLEFIRHHKAQIISAKFDWFEKY